MIQILHNSWRLFEKSSIRINIVCSVFVFILLSILSFNIDFNEEQMKNIISNLLSFSSVHSAIMITYITTKVFQDRNEKRELRLKVIELSNKLTDFRRICDKLISGWDIWNRTTKTLLENKYKDLTYQHIYDDYQENKPKKLIEEYKNDGKIQGGYFYLALRDLIRMEKGSLYGDNNIDTIYSIEKVKVCYGVGCANAFFYYLEDKYYFYKDIILIDNLCKEDKEYVEKLAIKINKDKYTNCKYGRDLLISIGNDFEIDIFGKLIENQEKFEEKFSHTLNTLIWSETFILVFGVLLPILYPFFQNCILLQKIIVFIGTMVLSITFINFIIDFKKILKKEFLF